MKAIQVLKNCLKYSDYGNDIEEKEYLGKAIAELQALVNRNCENCKYSFDDKNHGMMLCLKDDNKQEYVNNFYMQVTKDFCCNRWSDKEVKSIRKVM